MFPLIVYLKPIVNGNRLRLLKSDFIFTKSFRIQSFFWSVFLFIRTERGNLE